MRDETVGLTLADSHFVNEKNYWLKKLSGLEEKTRFYYDFPSENKPSATYDGVECCFTGESFQKLQKLSRGYDYALHVLLAAGLVTLLAKHTGSRDIVTGTTIYKQDDTDCEFVNTLLVLRENFDDKMTFKEFLGQVKKTIVEAVENQNYPVERLIHQLNMTSVGDDFPLFDVALLLENIHEKAHLDAVNPNMVFSFFRTGESVNGTLQYNPSLFKRSTVEQIVSHYVHLLEKAIFNVDSKLVDIEILTGEDRRRLTVELTGIKEEYPADITVSRLFEEQAQKIPGDIALTFENVRVTYDELNRRANQVAAFLREKNARPGEAVGLIMERSVEMIVGLLAVMKAGGACLPIDPEFPSERVKYILGDCNAGIVLTNVRMESLGRGIQVIDLREEDKITGGGYSPASLENVNKGSDLVYIIYTSGSTGKPKGVMLEHRNLVNLIMFQYKHTNIDFSSVLQFTTICFDVSFQEIFSTLLAGGTLHLIDNDTRNDVPAMFEVVERKNIKTLFMAASFLKFIFNEEHYIKLIPGGVEHIVAAGEQLTLSERFKRYLRENNTYLHNHYGPSETHVVTTLTLEPREDLPELPSIGKPISNTNIFILDNNMRMLPVGVPGHLYIGGAQVGRGYINRPESTWKSFISLTNVSESLPGADLLYKTGDLARWLPDGNIEFLGRADSQVKIRGFRVELEEIENRLLNIEGIKETVVLAKEEESGQSYLCAYIVSDGELVPPVLRERLSGDLPEYMIPTAFVKLEHIPLTRNGKIDRKALPEPNLKKERKIIPPRNENENKLRELWAEVLNIPESELSIYDNFFDIGGHSLKATILITLIHKIFETKITLAELFASPTIASLSERVRSAGQDRYASIKPIPQKDYYPLSSAQKRLFFIQQMDAVDTTYNLPGILSFNGKIDSKLMEDVFKKLIRRHEILRTSFEIVDNQPIQKIHNHVDFSITVQKVSSLSDETRLAEIVGSFLRPFDLGRPPLLRAQVLETGENEHFLLLDIHHIIADGTSLEVLKKDIAQLYRGHELEPLRLQYKDYTSWQYDMMESGRFSSQDEYWEEVFRGEIPRLNLLTDFQRPAIFSFKGDYFEFPFEWEISSRVKELCKRNDATLFMVLTALLNVMFFKYTGQEDIIIGSAISGRPHADLREAMGMFVNMLGIRNFPSGDKSFIQFLGEVKERCIKAYENQDVQFEDLVDRLNIERDVSRNPLFDVSLVVQNFSRHDIREYGFSDETFRFVKYRSMVSRFDLTFSVFEDSEDIYVYIEYYSDIFNKETIRRMTEHFKNTILAVIDAPSSLLKDIQIVSREEKQEILNLLGRPLGNYSTHKTIHQLFEEQVSRSPGEIAVFFEDETLTYHELDREARQLANYLSIRGVGNNIVVGLLLKRSSDMIIAILASLMAGGAYVPLNPGAPFSRNRYILKECNARLLLTHRSLHGEDQGGEDWEGDYIFWDTLGEIDAGNPMQNIQHSSSSLAYIIFTSGSTGKPKGVPITHANLTPLLHWGHDFFGFNSTDRVFQNISYYFDWSVWEIFITLTSGAALYTVPEETAMEPAASIDFIDRNQLTVLHITPTQYRYYLDELNSGQRMNSLKYLLFGAEKLPVELVTRSFEKVSEDCLVFNTYGPTETAVTASVLKIDRNRINRYKALSGIPLGGTTANTTFLVLDKHLEVCPVGVCGELHIGGKGLSAGYLNDPEKTHYCFIKNIYKDRDFPGETLYKTGDLARWLPGGDIEFLGRVDHQVKIRGFRIEPGEIENQLLKHDHVKETIVIPRSAGGDETGEKFLCAYIVPGTDESIDAAVLKEFLLQSLPDYMIPSYFISIGNIPLNPNGKIDRKALPMPEKVHTDRYEAPGNQIEEVLVTIWADILKLDPESIGVKDDFFQLGGHSLKATVLVTKIHKEMDVKIPLAEVFRRPNIRGISDYIKSSVKGGYLAIPKAEEKDFYLLSSAQKRLYILHHMEPDCTDYNGPAFFPVEGKLDKTKINNVFNGIIQRHEILRTSFHMIDREPYQKIHETIDFKVEYYGPVGLAEEKKLTGDFIKPFDLSRPPLLRVGFLERAEGRHMMLFDMHHIITDGTSMKIFIEDFHALYSGEELPPLKLQYKDYSQWQNTISSSGRLKDQETYWLKKLEGDIPLLNLPTDFPRPEFRSPEGDFVTFEIEEKLARNIENFVLKSGATTYLVLLTAYVLLFFKLTGQEDFVVGAPIAGRTHNDLQNIMGLFVNMLIMRNRPQGEKTIQQFLEEVKVNALEAYENQDYQFDELIDKLTFKREPGRHALIDAIILLQNQVEAGEYSSGTRFEDKNNGASLRILFDEDRFPASRFDLYLNATPGENKISISFYYASTLFKRSSIEKLAQFFLEILQQITAEPGMRLEDINLSKDSQGVQPQRELFEEIKDIGF